MALTRVTKHIIHGSLLVQFKYTENSGSWVLSSSRTTFTKINNKNVVMTPQYADSILENSASMTMRQEAGNNNNDQLAIALFVNGSNEYEQTNILGNQPYGNNHSHTGGRNDRTAPTRRHGHITNQRAAVGFTHTFTPASTNAQDMDVRARNISADRNFSVQDFFFICKEISIGITSLSGDQT